MNRRHVVSIAWPLVAFAVLFWFADVDILVRILNTIRYEWVLFAGLVHLSLYVPISLRWLALQRNSGSATSPRQAFEIMTISTGLNAIFPANSGDIARSKLVAFYDPVDSHARILGLVTVERLADVATVSMLMALGVAVAPPLSASDFTVDTTTGSRLLMIGLFIVLLVAGSWRFLSPKMRRHVVEFRSVFSDLTAGTLLLVVWYTIVRWVGTVVVLVFLSTALGVGIDVGTAALVVGSMSLAFILPLSPGGVGTVEAVGTGVLTALAVPYETALSLVLLQRSIGWGLSGLVGYLVYNYRMARTEPAT